MELQGFMERQKIPSYFLNVTKNSGSYGVALIIQRVKYSLVMKRKRTFDML